MQTCQKCHKTFPDPPTHRRLSYISFRGAGFGMLMCPQCVELEMVEDSKNHHIDYEWSKVI